MEIVLMVSVREVLNYIVFIVGVIFVYNGV